MLFNLISVFIINFNGFLINALNGGEDFELIFTMLGERSTTEIHRTEDSQGVPKLRADAKAGGDIAGGARKKLEKRLRHSIVSKNNFKILNENKKLR